MIALEQKRIILDETAMQRAVARISYEILEHNKGAADLCVIGIHSRGVAIGKRIADKLSELEKIPISFGAIDITPYRDDILGECHTDMTDIPFDVKNMKVLLVDDVIFTGRTARAAMDGIIKRGRPESVQLAVLIDRGHRELPIRPDYVGKNLPTSRSELVSVSVKEHDGSDFVAIYDKR